MEEPKLIIKDKEIISRGATAMVYHGLWKTMPVAVKKMNPDTPQQKIKTSEKFQVERQVLTELGTHPGIIQLYAWVKNPPCLVLECGERELRSRLFFDQKEWGPVSVELRMQYAVQIVEGVIFMHGKRVAHLDLNLENIVLVNGARQAKIIDFGNSKQFPLNQESYESQFTFGTPGYVAPEAAYGIYGFKSDVWSFGVILWGLVTYKDPRKGGPTRENPQWDLSPPAEFPECTETQVAFMQSFWRPESKERPAMEEALITEMKSQFNIPERIESAQESNAKSSAPSKGCSIC